MNQSREAQWLIRLSREGGDEHFKASSGLCLGTRDTCWYAIALLFSDNPADRALGNRLLSTVPSEDGTHTPATMIAILKFAGDRLDERAASWLRLQIAQELPHAAETEWRDGNVNHPLGAYCALICGGGLSGEDWAPELGVRRLRRFRDRIGNHRSVRLRQAEMSEYNSLTYSALDLCFLAIIAECAEDDAARRLGLQLEQGLWIDAAMHFHAPSQQFAGPHSRSYMEDSLGGFSVLHGVFLAAGFGPLFMAPELSVRFEHPSNLIQNSLTALIPFHPPEEALAIAWKKPFPYTFRKITFAESYQENSRRGRNTGSALPQPDAFAFDEEVYPGGWTDLTTHMTSEYALGSAARPYVNGGHSDSVNLRIRRAEKVGSLADFRSMFVRGVFNGALPGRHNFSHVAGLEIDSSYLYEEGRSFIYQHENRCIVLYNPKRAGHLGFTRFEVQIIFGFQAPFDRVAIDGAEITGFPQRARAGSVLCFQDFDTYILMKPVPLVPQGSDEPLSLRVVPDFLLLSLISYEGPPLDLTREEINGWKSGFFIEVWSKSDFGGWEDFLAHAAAVVVKEEGVGTVTRKVVCESGGHTMEFQCDPYRESVVSRRWDGQEEFLEHFEVSAGGRRSGPFVPVSLFGTDREQA